MTKRELINICLEFPDMYEDYPFELLTDTPEAKYDRSFEALKRDREK